MSEVNVSYVRDIYALQGFQDTLRLHMGLDINRIQVWETGAHLPVSPHFFADFTLNSPFINFTIEGHEILEALGLIPMFNIY